MAPVSDANGVYLPARTVPWPVALSQEARQQLVEMVQRAEAGEWAWPDADDFQGWRACIAQVDANILPNVPHLMQAERQGIHCETTVINGVVTYIATPETIRPEARDCIYLDIHGGGMVLLGGEGCRRGALTEAERLGARVFSVDYRVPPDHPYPAGLDDCLSVYSHVLKEYGATRVVVGGISGGSNLAAAVCLRARDEGLALPAGLVLLTPELDLTESGDSFDSILDLDPVLRRLTNMIGVYAQGADLTHPYLSPLFGDFSKGYPRTLLQSGTRDLFLSNTVRMHRALRLAGIEAELHIWDGMPHGGFAESPELTDLSAEIRRFVTACWNAPR